MMNKNTDIKLQDVMCVKCKMFMKRPSASLTEFSRDTGSVIGH